MISNTIVAYIGLGSNLGDRAGHLLCAVKNMLDIALPLTRVSSVYETSPVDTFDQPIFLNAVVELSGPKLPAPDQLLSNLLQIEKNLGRDRSVLRGPRTIDLDLLFYENQLLESEDLVVPHPRLHLRKFVLAPLAELTPNLIHPRLNKTIYQLLMEIGDNQVVKKWSPH
jgi:2-amino-4-hydroxy-6-hydroxymethyldihydropteridine diphosphokinase